jgi:hypothetical protein
MWGVTSAVRTPWEVLLKCFTGNQRAGTRASIEKQSGGRKPAVSAFGACADAQELQRTKKLAVTGAPQNWRGEFRKMRRGWGKILVCLGRGARQNGFLQLSLLRQRL